MVDKLTILSCSAWDKIAIASMGHLGSSGIRVNFVTASSGNDVEIEERPLRLDRSGARLLATETEHERTDKGPACQSS